MTPALLTAMSPFQPPLFEARRGESRTYLGNGSHVIAHAERECHPFSLISVLVQRDGIWYWLFLQAYILSTRLP